MALPTSQAQIRPKEAKGEDRISSAPGLPAFFRLTPESQKNVMIQAVASLDKILLQATGFQDGSTLSRVNIFTKNSNGEKVVQIAGCTVGDSPIILADEKKSTFLTSSHNLNRAEMQTEFKANIVNRNIVNRLNPEVNDWRHVAQKDRYGLLIASHIAMGRSMNDRAHKKDPDFTSKPETVVQELQGPCKIILASDGIFHLANQDTYKADDPYVSPPRITFEELDAEYLVDDACDQGSTDDISAIVIDIPADLPEEKEFCASYGVDDGHSGADTANFCSQYYYPIQHFWTVIYDAYQKAIPADFQLNQIQQRLVAVFDELLEEHQHISAVSLLLHPDMVACLQTLGINDVKLAITNADINLQQEQRFCTLSNRIRGGLLSDWTKIQLGLGVLGVGFASYLHHTEGDFFNLLPQNSDLPNNLEIGTFSVAGLCVAWVMIKLFMAYQAKKELTQQLSTAYPDYPEEQRKQPFSQLI